MQIRNMQKECKKFKIKNLGEYHDFFLKINTLLLVDCFENFKKMCLEIYQLDPAISVASNFKKDRSKIRIVN